MFALLLITVLIGVSANAMDIAGNKILEYSSEQSLQRIAGDTADVLIKTPGVPENWDEGKYFTTATPGLAEIDSRTNMVVENMLNMRKMLYLERKSRDTEEDITGGNGLQFNDLSNKQITSNYCCTRKQPGKKRRRCFSS